MLLEKTKEKISVIGAGRLGGALAIALARKGYKIQNLVSRRRENAERVARFIESKPRILAVEDWAKLSASDVVLIAAPDPEIAKIAALLAAEHFPPETIFLHTSGSLRSDVLIDLKTRGAAIGSIHPLVSVSDAHSGTEEKFRGVYFCVEGDWQATAFAERAVTDLGGKHFTLKTEFKPLYHAAAVMTAGHLTALFDAATVALAQCGLERADAQRILLPLAASAIENLKTQTPEAALTGTFARADLETMRQHLAALQRAVSRGADENILEIYRALGLRSIELARKRGANPETLEEMSQELARDKK